jgi:tetratricopeptide (TPR) repeat protein
VTITTDGTAANTAETCLGVIFAGAKLLKQGDPAKAERAFAAALMMTHVPGPSELSRPQSAAGNLALRSLALYNVGRLHLRRGGRDPRPFREQAAVFLADSAGREQLPPQLLPLFQVLMADVLVELSEYHRAIPYCEASIQLMMDENNAPAMADSMWRAGRCYARTGLRDHAAIPLRAAVKIFRTLAGDPRLPAVLLDLGNALKKSSPAESERCYREVADLHVARVQLESATPAWVNLGVMCNEQGRHAEALAYYEKALHVREQSPRTPPERIGSVMNNMANAHRRMGEFETALDCVDRALRILEPVRGYSLACAYGTRGLILRDAGRDMESVEWFRKSSAEHQAQASPNLETLSEELEHEATALERLGRLEEAADARRRLESVRAAIAGVETSAVETVDLDADGLKPAAEGAVLIELDFGTRAGGVYGKSDSIKLGRKLSVALKAGGAGYYGGSVVIPETTTFLCYGADAEALFGTVEPILREERMCGRARITVRQGGQHREVLLPGPVM